MAPSCVLWLLTALALLTRGAEATHVAGATSASGIFASVYHYYSNRAAIGAFSATGSLKGISLFNSRLVLAAASDAPMTLAQERAAGPKYTLAQAVASYSFVVSGSRTVRLSAGQIYAIYAGRITLWQQIPGSGLRGTIVPVARSVGAGSTAVVTRWIQQSRIAIPAAQVGMGIWRAGSRHMVYQPSSQAVAAYVRRNRLAIGYAQTAVGVAPGNFEVAVLNRATGHYQVARGANLLRAVPAHLPPAAASWSGVPNALLNTRYSYPIVAFVHVFARQHNGRAVGIIKPFLKFLMTQEAQALCARAGFQPIPGWLKGNNLLAIGLIRV